MKGQVATRWWTQLWCGDNLVLPGGTQNVGVVGELECKVTLYSPCAMYHRACGTGTNRGGRGFRVHCSKDKNVGGEVVLALEGDGVVTEYLGAFGTTKVHAVLPVNN